MFTIEVKKKGKDKEFSFSDVEMRIVHSNCYDGEAHWSKNEEDLYIMCNRCGGSTRLKYEEKESMEQKIVKTAIDGKKRWISWLRISVIQKI